MAYPSFEQYNQAFQAHARLLADPELKNGVVSTTGFGLPLAISGGFALTYTIQSGSKKYAVKCFHRESKALEKRYIAISQRLAQLSSPYFLDFQFQPQGIVVGGTAYPVVKMAWAQGETIGEFFENNYKDKSALSSLASSLATMGAYLERERIAHGDLQTGNLMVSGNGRTLQLIDYDGMFVDEINGLGSSELGQLNFQHPQRKSKNPFDPSLDRFSLIAIFLALKALQEDASIWNKSKSDFDAFVFRANDFLDPASSQIFATLMAMPALAQDTKNFAAICKSPFEKIPSLADFIARRNIPLASIEIRGKLQTGQAKQGYLGAYAVLAADNYEACLSRVGDKVEVIGCIVGIKEDRARNKKPYMFINFGDWRGNIFKIAIWSEGLEAILTKPDQSWVGQWVSVVGLMEPPYTNDKYAYSHLSINVVANGQISIVSETEAKWRLAAPGAQSKVFSPSNRETLQRIKGREGLQNSTVVAIQPAATPYQAVSSNQNVLNKIRSAQQGTSHVQKKPPASPHSTNNGGRQPPPQKLPEKGIITKIFDWLFK